MTVKEYVDNVLCVPVTRVGNRFIVEAIEIVVDTKEHKFYERLADIHNTSTKYLEKAMRTAKSISLLTMSTDSKLLIFGKLDVPTNEYILKSAEFYRRNYSNEDKA